MGLNEKFFASATTVIDPILYLDAGDSNSYSGTGTTWYDLTANNNDATITGATWNSGGYFEVQSSDFFSLPQGAPFNRSNTIKCISGWIKADTTTSRVWLFNISSSTNTSDYFYIGYIPDANLITVYTRDGSSSNQSFSQATITPNTDWNHIVVQITSTEREIYLNGTKLSTTVTNVGTGNATSWIDYPSYSGTIKGEIGRLRAASPAPSHYSDGQISKVRLYDKTLTQIEITALHSEGR